MNARKITICLILLVLALIGAGVLILRTSNGPRKPVASIALGDGRILQVEAVTYGTNHHVGNQRSGILWRFSGWLPRPLYNWLMPKNPEGNIGPFDSPVLVVWVNALSEAGGTNVDCQSIRVELVNEQGEHFEAATSSWSGGQTFWRVGHIFKIYPRDESKLKLEVTTWTGNKTNRMEFANPHVERAAAWTGGDLPQESKIGDLSVALKKLRLQTNGIPAKYFTTRTVYWEPVWELRRGQERLDGWEKPDWQAEDALGNQGQFLGTNQPVLRFSATFYPMAGNSAAAQLLATLPEVTVTNQKTITWWNQPVPCASGNILALGFFPASNYVFQGGVMLTNPPVYMGPVRGGAPSGWTGQSQVVNPLKVIEYNGYYSSVASVIFLSAPKLGDETRLAVRLKDEDGREWDTEPESQGSQDGIYPFLVRLSPEVKRVTPEVRLLKPVKAEFTVKIPKGNSSGP